MPRGQYDRSKMKKKGDAKKVEAEKVASPAVKKVSAKKTEKIAAKTKTVSSAPVASPTLAGAPQQENPVDVVATFQTLAHTIATLSSTRTFLDSNTALQAKVDEELGRLVATLGYVRQAVFGDTAIAPQADVASEEEEEFVDVASTGGTLPQPVSAMSPILPMGNSTSFAPPPPPPSQG